MTTTRTASRRCPDCNVPLRAGRNYTPAQHSDLCDDCFDYAGWENHHDDNGHDDDTNDSDCRVCTGDQPVWHDAKAPKTADTKPQSWSSHKGHDHPSTPKARAACRKARKARKA